MTLVDRALLALAGLAGLLGVALSAASAHVPGGAALDTAARFLLIHAAVVVAIVALVAGGAVDPRWGRAAAWALLGGLVLFSGDLAMRTFAGTRLAPFAAPAGGFLLMGGWALVVLAALTAPRF